MGGAHSVVLALAVASGAGIYGVLASRTQERAATAGFWFEDVSFGHAQSPASVVRAP